MCIVRKKQLQKISKCKATLHDNFVFFSPLTLISASRVQIDMCDKYEGNQVSNVPKTCGKY
jgi:hypothetical protein